MPTDTPKARRKPDGSVVFDGETMTPPGSVQPAVQGVAAGAAAGAMPQMVSTQDRVAAITKPVAPAAPSPAQSGGSAVNALPGLIGMFSKMMGSRTPIAPEAPGVPPIQEPASALNPVRAQDEAKALQHEKFLMLNGPTEQRDLGRLQAINSRLTQISRISAPAAQPVSPDEAVAQLQRRNEMIRGSAASDLTKMSNDSVDAYKKGEQPDPARIAEMNRVGDVLSKYTNQDPLDLLGEAQKRVNESQAAASRTDAQRAVATQDETARVARERYALSQARDAEIAKNKQAEADRGLAMAQTGAATQVANAQGQIATAQGAAAGSANDPEGTRARRELEMELVRQQIAKAKAETDAIGRGLDPATRQIANQSAQGALERQAVNLDSASSVFDTLLGSIRSSIGSGGLVDTFLGVPTGQLDSTVAASIPESASGVSSVTPAVKELENQLQPIIAAAAMAPNPAIKSWARLQLSKLPPVSASGQYTYRARDLNPALSASRSAAADKLNQIRATLEQLAK